MNALLKPGMRTLERFRFARKFQLLALMFILPLAYAAWVIGQTYLEKLWVVDGERAGVRQLQALDRVELALVAQRNLTARWKAESHPPPGWQAHPPGRSATTPATRAATAMSRSWAAKGWPSVAWA